MAVKPISFFLYMCKKYTNIYKITNVPCSMLLLNYTHFEIYYTSSYTLFGEKYLAINVLINKC